MIVWLYERVFEGPISPHERLHIPRLLIRPKNPLAFFRAADGAAFTVSGVGIPRITSQNRHDIPIGEPSADQKTGFVDQGL